MTITYEHQGVCLLFCVGYVGGVCLLFCVGYVGGVCPLFSVGYVGRVCPLFCVGYVRGVCLLLEKGWVSPCSDGDCEVCWSPGQGLWVGVACVVCKARRTIGEGVMGWFSSRNVQDR